MLPVSTAENCETNLSEHKDMENPPTFIFECLNGRQQRELLKIKDGLDDGDDLKNMDEIFEVVESYLQGWRNLGIKYTKGMLIEVINYSQGLELLGQLVFQRPSVADKKKSKSQSPSNTESSVKPVKAAKSATESSIPTPDGDSTG